MKSNRIYLAIAAVSALSFQQANAAAGVIANPKSWSQLYDQSLDLVSTQTFVYQNSNMSHSETLIKTKRDARDEYLNKLEKAAITEYNSLKAEADKLLQADRNINDVPFADIIKSALGTVIALKDEGISDKIITTKTSVSQKELASSWTLTRTKEALDIIKLLAHHKLADLPHNDSSITIEQKDSLYFAFHFIPGFELCVDEGSQYTSIGDMSQNVRNNLWATKTSGQVIPENQNDFTVLTKEIASLIPKVIKRLTLDANWYSNKISEYAKRLNLAIEKAKDVVYLDDLGYSVLDCIHNIRKISKEAHKRTYTDSQQKETPEAMREKELQKLQNIIIRTIMFRDPSTSHLQVHKPAIVGAIMALELIRSATDSWIADYAPLTKRIKTALVAASASAPNIIKFNWKALTK